MFDLDQASRDHVTLAITRRARGVAPLTGPEQIAVALGEEIVDGRAAPGQRLGEAELAERFSSSRAPVREALRILETHTLVRILPRRGAHVTPLEPAELTTLYRVRACLLGLAAEAIARRGDREEIDEIAGSCARLVATAKAANPGARYFPLALAMTLRLATLSASPHVVHLVGALSLQARRYARLAFPDKAACTQSATLWRELSTVLSAGDADAAREAAEAIVLASLTRIEASIAQS
ncbi:MAG: GntR family transcriptional regulator [Pseudomonadota bacterium]